LFFAHIFVKNKSITSNQDQNDHGHGLSLEVLVMKVKARNNSFATAWNQCNALIRRFMPACRSGQRV